MKNKLILIGLFSIIVFSLITMDTPKEVKELETFDVDMNLIKASYSLPSFGVDITESLTDDTITLSDNEKFDFSFEYNISLVNPSSSIDAYGSGSQPDIFWNNQLTETRICGGLNVYIDDLDLGISNFDPYEGNTTQTFALELEIGIHYLTIIAAEYQLPYQGASLDEAELIWVKDQHVFTVIENAGDTIDSKPMSNVYVETVDTPYAEDFSDIHTRYEKPVIKYGSIVNNIDHAIINYDYNVSTDDTFDATMGSSFVDYSKVGTGEVKLWINDYAFSTMNLSIGKNYVYICAASAKPHDQILAFYSEYSPMVAFDTLILEIIVDDGGVTYEEVTETTTITNEETVTETETEYTETVTETETENNAEANFSLLVVPAAIISLIAVRTIKRKNDRRIQT